MRLYNSQSCTPVGSSSMYVTPKGSPPRKDLPQSPTAFARNWKLQKNGTACVDSRVASQSFDISSPHKVSRITSLFFDPFEISNMQFSMDPFKKTGGSHSSATSATERLTPVVSSESHDLFALSDETDEFLTFSDPFPNREIEFQCPEEEDMFNDANTWMTSSTLSTKFTNREVTKVTRKSSGGPLRDNRATFSPAFGLQSPVDIRTATNPWPDEVFVSTQRQSYPHTFPHLRSEASPKTENGPLCKRASSSYDAFDPFATDSIAERPTVKQQEYPDNFEKENRPLQYLPPSYVASKKNIGDITNESARFLQATSMDPKKEVSSMNQTLQKNERSMYRSQHSEFVSSPPRHKLLEPPVKKPGPLQALAIRNNARSQLDLMLSSRAPASLLRGLSETAPSKYTMMSGFHRPSSTSDEEEFKVSTRIATAEMDEIHGRPSLRQLQSKRAIEDSAKEKTKVIPTTKNRHPSSRLRSFMSPDALTSGKSHLAKIPAEVSKENAKVTTAGAPGSFLAERVEAARPVAAFHGNEDATSPPSSSPIGRSKPTGTKQSSPVVTKVKEFAQGNSLQDVLSLRFGTRLAEEEGEKMSGPPKVDDDTKVDQMPKTADSALSGKFALKDDPAHAKYFKMLKMGLPMGAVKNAMERDGVDPLVMDGDHSSPTGKQFVGGIALKDDPAYAKYFKMLKMGLPMGAVKNAMERDGVDPSVMDGDHSAPAGKMSRGRVAMNDDPKYAKYFNMLKMGLPMGAVKNAMERDGVDSTVMDGDPSAQAGGEKVIPLLKKVPRDKYRRTRIHWETHKTVRSNTVWAMVSRDPDVSDLNVDEEEFSNLFQAEAKPSAQPAAPIGAAEKGAVKVIDKKRANNGGITLARIKLSYEEIAVAVDSYDVSALTQEQIRGVLQYLPTSEEKTAIYRYFDSNSSDTDCLCECEKFMAAIMSVKHAKRKLHAILFMQKFSSSLEELRRDARLVQKACDEIMGSSRFRKILGIVLNLGNRLNTAGPMMKEPASAVTLESLLKLNQPKAFDKKTTFLQYVAGVVRRNNASLCHFKDDLAAVFTAEKILWESTLSELKRMENELESVRRLALYHALEKDRDQSSSRGSANGDSVAAMSIPSKISVEEEIRLLQKTSIGNFTLDACARMAVVVDEIDNAKTSYNALLLYFGEEDNASAQPNDVFRTISVFSKDFECALAAVVETENMQLREAKHQRPRKRPPAPPSVSDENEDSDGSGGAHRKRVSSGMGGVLNELRKPNLKWRRRKHVP